MSRLHRMWQRSFDHWFLQYRERGSSEEWAIKLAEEKATDEMDRYVDEKIEERKLGEP